MGCPSSVRVGILGKREGSFLKQVGISGRILSLPTLCCCKNLKSQSFGGWQEEMGSIRNANEARSAVCSCSLQRKQEARSLWAKLGKLSKLGT